jgi:transposase
MDFFAGLDISMDETHVCVLDREGAVVREQDRVDGGGYRRRIGESAELSSHRVRDRTHGADPFPRVEPAWSPSGLRREPTGLPGAQVTCDPQDARGLAHLARTGFFKPVPVKSLRAHAVCSLIIPLKKLVGQRVTLENQLRGLVVFGIRLPRGLAASPATPCTSNP